MGRIRSNLKRAENFLRKHILSTLPNAEEIFDLLVKDGQMIVPLGAKMLPLEQRKKRGFCKYHNCLGYKTSQCFLFRDLVHNAIRDVRLNFGEKAKSQMNIDSNPLQGADDHYTEPPIVNMVEVSEGHDENTTVIRTTEGLNQETNITEAIGGLRAKLKKLKTTDDTN